jgi:ankyrin repeat protein
MNKMSIKELNQYFDKTEEIKKRPELKQILEKVPYAIRQLTDVYPDILCQACFDLDYRRIKYLLDNGANPWIYYENGYPIHYLFHHNRRGHDIDFYISNILDLLPKDMEYIGYTVDKFNKTPIQYCIENGYTVCAKKLIKYGVRHIPTPVEILKTPLTTAEETILESIKKILIKYSPIPLCRPLMYNEDIMQSKFKAFEHTFIAINDGKVTKIKNEGHMIAFITIHVGVSGHAMIGVFDTKKKQIQLVDSNGPRLDYVFYTLAKKALLEYYTGYSVKDLDIECSIGPLRYSTLNSMKICPDETNMEDFGYCGIYAVFFAILKIQNPLMTSESLYKVLTELSKEDEHWIERFINYLRY